MFAPSLFIGSMLGGSLGLMFAQLVPGIPGPPGAYALVGMGAVFAGATHASMTAVLIIFEMTGDYKIILPLMLAVVTSSLISGAILKRETIYTLKLTRRGVRLRRGRALDVLEGVRVEEVMSQTETVHPDAPVEGLQESFLKANRNAFPVVDEGRRLAGIVSLNDVRRKLESRDDVHGIVVRDIMTENLITAFPDENLNAVLQRMAPRDLSRLPVVSRSHPDRLLGVVRRNDVVRAYDLGLARRGREVVEIPEGVRSDARVDFIEVVLTSRSRLRRSIGGRDQFGAARGLAAGLDSPRGRGGHLSPWEHGASRGGLHRGLHSQGSVGGTPAVSRRSLTAAIRYTVTMPLP